MKTQTHFDFSPECMEVHERISSALRAAIERRKAAVNAGWSPAQRQRRLASAVAVKRGRFVGSQR